MPGHVMPSTLGRRAVVDVCPSIGYSDHLVSERKANAGVQANEEREGKDKIIDVISENTQACIAIS
jgi:hypothetical protein